MLSSTLRALGRALWALAVLPLLIFAAVFSPIVYLTDLYLSLVWECAAFLWRNMGPDCMTTPKEELDARR